MFPTSPPSPPFFSPSSRFTWFGRRQVWGDCFNGRPWRVREQPAHDDSSYESHSRVFHRFSIPLYVVVKNRREFPPSMQRDRERNEDYRGGKKISDGIFPCFFPTITMRKYFRHFPKEPTPSSLIVAYILKRNYDNLFFLSKTHSRNKRTFKRLVCAILDSQRVRGEGDAEGRETRDGYGGRYARVSSQRINRARTQSRSEFVERFTHEEMAVHVRQHQGAGVIRGWRAPEYKWTRSLAV